MKKNEYFVTSIFAWMMALLVVTLVGTIGYTFYSVIMELVNVL